jgi:hypothetical protein
VDQPRVLVAGTADAILALAQALHGAAEVVPAESVKEALAQLDRGPFHTIACNIRFDESRMFEFLQAVMERKLAGVRLVAFRLDRRPLSKGSRAAIGHALEALGVEHFVDFAQVRLQYDEAAAMETLRKVVLDVSFVPPTPPTNKLGTDPN